MNSLGSKNRHLKINSLLFFPPRNHLVSIIRLYLIYDYVDSKFWTKSLIAAFTVFF